MKKGVNVKKNKKATTNKNSQKKAMKGEKKKAPPRSKDKKGNWPFASTKLTNKRPMKPVKTDMFTSSEEGEQFTSSDGRRWTKGDMKKKPPTKAQKKKMMAVLGNLADQQEDEAPEYKKMMAVLGAKKMGPRTPMLKGPLMPDATLTGEDVPAHLRAPEYYQVFPLHCMIIPPGRIVVGVVP